MKSSKGYIQNIMIGCLGGVVGGLLTLATVKATTPGQAYFTVNEPSQTTAATAPNTGGGTYLPSSVHGVGNADFTRAAESTVNGVVSIKSYARPHYSRSNRGAMPFFDDPFFEFFFGPQQRPQAPQDGGRSEQQTGLGSGVIISEDGYIVTNNHVIADADRLEVTLNDNRTFDATVIGADPTTDLALVKIDTTGLPVIPIGDSDALKVGEWVLAVGNPFGFTSTVTAGIVSAKARSISNLTNTRGNSMGIEAYIQTDAAVNPGNSGGALVNLNGELIGINTAIYSQTGSYTGYSFAVPTSLVKKVVSDIRQYGTVQRARLGVSISELTSQLAREADITLVNEGVYVNSVDDNSSAASAGIRAGDVIVELGGQEVKNVSQLQELVNRYSPGDRITVKYVRDNKYKTADITLLNSRGDTQVTTVNNVGVLGCAFSTLSDELKEQLHISYGVQVVNLQPGKFRDAGIQRDFIVQKINNIPINKPSDIEGLYETIMNSSDGERVMFITGLYPSGKAKYYAVPLE